MTQLPQSERLRKNFEKLLEYEIHTHDAYSGTGAGSFSLHLQYKDMLSDGLTSCKFSKVELNVNILPRSLESRLVIFLPPRPHTRHTF
jgi:hypothetical protein